MLVSRCADHPSPQSRKGKSRPTAVDDTSYHRSCELWGLFWGLFCSNSDSQQPILQVYRNRAT
eukprot:jgi/Botrbrau1/8224/Bobra.0392s0020.1